MTDVSLVPVILPVFSSFKKSYERTCNTSPYGRDAVRNTIQPPATYAVQQMHCRKMQRGGVMMLRFGVLCVGDPSSGWNREGRPLWIPHSSIYLPQGKLALKSRVSKWSFADGTDVPQVAASDLFQLRGCFRLCVFFKELPRIHRRISQEMISHPVTGLNYLHLA